jgi:hypothetical protein
MAAKKALVIGALALAGAMSPVFVALETSGGTAVAQCRAYFGSRVNGTCIDGPSDSPPGTPPISIGPTDGGGAGISTGPLFPGQTITTPLGL